MAKGGNYEREFARQLSLWYTWGTDDSVFWRVNASGGRARVRAKSGKRTDNQYGDICAVKAMGNALTDRTVWELKRGYHSWSPFDVIDKAAHRKATVFETFWSQVIQAQADAGGDRIPMLVFRRDQRVSCIAFPYNQRHYFRQGGTMPAPPGAMLAVSRELVVLIVRVENFFAWADPGMWIHQ